MNAQQARELARRMSNPQYQEQFRPMPDNFGAGLFSVEKGSSGTVWKYLRIGPVAFSFQVFESELDSQDDFTLALGKSVWKSLEVYRIDEEAHMRDSVFPDTQGSC